MSDASLDYRKLNRRKLVDFFNKGDTYTQKLGFELEHILLHKGTNAPVSYSEPGGVHDILRRLAPAYERELHDGGDIVGLARPGETITIEPAGQLEISAGPFEDVVDIERAYLDFRNRLNPILEEYGLFTPMLGYNPSARAADLELVPKYRYECMTEFLGAQAYEGICMMRGSASLQVSVDFENEADALRKMRIAQIIAPILSLICDNSPKFEAEERTRNLVRTHVWASMNQDRVGTVPGSLKAGYTFADYADYIMTREAILVPGDPNVEQPLASEVGRKGAGSVCAAHESATSEPNESAVAGRAYDVAGHARWRYVGATTFDDLYANRLMTDAEVEHALSMVWPDARLKNFVEIRPADAMPFEYCLAYVVLIRALFYSRRNLDVLESLLANVDESHIRQAKNALMSDGYGAQIYGRSVEFWADMLMVLASGSLKPGEWAYLEPLSSMVKYRFTLAEIWPRLMEKRNHMPAGLPNAPVIGVVPRYDFEWTGLAIGDGYLSGLLESGAVPIVLPLTSDPAHIARIVAACDGFLIPGGQDIDPACYGARREPHTHRSATSRDAMEQALVRAVVAADKPLLGICRGMQSLNVALGGTLHQDIHVMHPESDTGHVQGRPFDVPAHMVDVVDGTLLASIVGAPRLGVNTIHHQSVAKLGDGLVVSAISEEDGIVEGVELPSARFVVGVQWHPEHMWRTRPHSKRLFRALVEASMHE